MAQLEGLEFREAALRLAEYFHLPGSEEPRHRHDDEGTQEKAAGERNETPPRNEPLRFALKSLEANHTLVKCTGFRPATIQHFGAGYCSRGMMRGRVAIPIHNSASELVAYAGRATRKEEERTKYPPQFHRELEVYNLHRAEQAANPAEEGLIVTLDFLDVWRLFEIGFENAVVLMARTASSAQIELLLESPRAREQLIVLVKDTVPDGLLATLAKAFYVHLLEVRGWPVEIGKEELYGRRE